MKCMSNIKLVPLHPGDVIYHEYYCFSEAKTIVGYANLVGVDPTLLTLIMAERAKVDEDTADKLAKYHKTTKEFWLNMQNSYDKATS